MSNKEVRTCDELGNHAWTNDVAPSGVPTPHNQFCTRCGLRRFRINGGWKTA